MCILSQNFVICLFSNIKLTALKGLVKLNKSFEISY